MVDEFASILHKFKFVKFPKLGKKTKLSAKSLKISREIALISREIIIFAENTILKSKVQHYQDFEVVNIEVLDEYNELKQVHAELVEKTKHRS